MIPRVLLFLSGLAAIGCYDPRPFRLTAKNGESVLVVTHPEHNRVLLKDDSGIRDLSQGHDCLVFSRLDWHCKQDRWEWRMADGELRSILHLEGGFSAQATYYSGVRGELFHLKWVFSRAVNLWRTGWTSKLTWSPKI
jgi:hypothetical protein